MTAATFDSNPPDTESPGLRERKKIRTRAAIREHALRLFRTQGYHHTTVEQISAAAEISPATFFRYFPTKEDVVVQDDFNLVALEAFERQPPELGAIPAYRAALAATLASLAEADQAKLAENNQLKMSIPEVRARVIDQLARTIDALAEAIARRGGEPAAAGNDEACRHGAHDDVVARSTAGAIIGVLISATLPYHQGQEATADIRSIGERIDAALGCLEAGLSGPP